MAHRKVIDNYYNDINNLAGLLNTLVSSYRLLVGGANDLNHIAFAEKKDIKKALERAEELGKIIDNVIETLDNTGIYYAKYCNIKSEIMKNRIESNYILTEIDEELKLKE